MTWPLLSNGLSECGQLSTCERQITDAVDETWFSRKTLNATPVSRCPHLAWLMTALAQEGRAKSAGLALPQDYSRWTDSSARNFAMRSINFTGTGSESGKRIVPLLTLYDASWSLNAATMRSPAGYNE
jgi:hypothetical protein